MKHLGHFVHEDILLYNNAVYVSHTNFYFDGWTPRYIVSISETHFFQKFKKFDAEDIFSQFQMSYTTQMHVIIYNCIK